MSYLYFVLFQYMGCVEVFESRGMPVCEEALKVLRVSKIIDVYLLNEYHSEEIIYVCSSFCKLRFNNSSLFLALFALLRTLAQ